MSKTLICTNTLTVVHQIVYANHLHFYFRLAKNNPDDTFALFTPVRMTIDTCRNLAAKTALEGNFDYVMFIDDDVLLPFNAYEKLKSHNKDVVAGWTVIRGYPFNNMFFRYSEDKAHLNFYNDVKLDETDLVPVDAIGCSCVLIKCDVFRKMPTPYFVTGVHNTEDIYFCVKAREYIPEVGIFVDPTVRTPHILAQEAVTPENRELLKDYYDKYQIDELKPLPSLDADRGDGYLQLIGGEK